VSFLSLFNVQILNEAPEWVRARVLGISLLVVQGAIAIGSFTWGVVAAPWGVGRALLIAGTGALCATGLAVFFRFSEATQHLTPWPHWRLPEAEIAQIRNEDRVLVTVQYEVHPDQTERFIKVVKDIGRMRRRDGASRWGICRDMEMRARFLETFTVDSWAEHV